MPSSSARRRGRRLASAAATSSVLPLLLASSADAVAATCASQSLTVAPLQSNVLYVDAAQNYLGSYVGYRVTNSGSSAQEDLWVRLESFTGGVVAPASGAAATAPLALEDLAPAAATPAYAYLKATGQTAVAQTHQVVLYRGRPGSGGVELCRAPQTITNVFDVIKAAANKVNGASRAGTPSLGGTFTVTVSGDTGTIGAGPAYDPGVVRFSPAVAATWPSSAFRLIDVEHRLPTSGSVFQDVLWRGGLTFGDTPYTVTYTFRVVGPTTATTPIVPVQNIASGTQVKHTDPGTLSALAPIPVVTSDATVQTGAASSGPYEPASTVPLTATVDNDGTGAVTVDELVASIPDGWSYKPGSATLGGVAIPDPFVDGTTLRFVGPFTVPGGTEAELRFDTEAGDTGTSGTYEAIGQLAGGQIDATKAVGDDTPDATTLTVLGPPSAADDTVTAARDRESTWNLLANDELSGATPALTITVPPEHGTATVVDGKVVYTPAEGYTGPDSLRYEVTTAGGSSTADVAITVAAPPPAPEPAGESSYGTGVAPQTATIEPPEGGSAKLVLPEGGRGTTWTRPGVGVYELDPDTGELTFTPELGYVGAATVDVEVTDAFGQTGTATYTATVVPPAGPDAAPLTSTGVGRAVQTRAISVPEGGTATLLSGTTPVTRLEVPGEGVYAYDAGRHEVTFTPEVHFHGEATPVAYRVTDAYGQSDDATHTPTVTLPEGPVATAKTSTGASPAVQQAALDLPEDGTVELLDALGAPASTVSVLGQGVYALDAATGTVTFTPAPFFHGTADPVDYRAVDAYGQPSAPSTYTPTVTPPGGPSAAARTSSGVGTAVQAATVTVPGGATIRLLSGTTPVTRVTVGGQGTYEVDPATGRLTFTPVLGFHGVATPVTYRITDGYGQEAEATYTATVTLPSAPPAPPRATTGTGAATQHEVLPVPPGGSVALVAPDGRLVTRLELTEGVLEVDPATGAVTFTPAEGFAGTVPAVGYVVTDAYRQQTTGSYAATVVAAPAVPTPETVAQAPEAPRTPPAAKAICVSRRSMTINWRVVPGSHVRRIAVTMNGVRVATLGGAARRVTVDMRGRPKGTFVVRITGRTGSGRVVRAQRTYRTCVTRKLGAPLPTLRLR